MKEELRYNFQSSNQTSFTFSISPATLSLSLLPLDPFLPQNRLEMYF